MRQYRVHVRHFGLREALVLQRGSIPGETFAHGSVVAGACGLSLMTFNALVADLALLVPLVRSPCIVARPLARGVHKNEKLPVGSVAGDLSAGFSCH